MPRFKMCSEQQPQPTGPPQPVVHPIVLSITTLCGKGCPGNCAANNNSCNDIHNGIATQSGLSTCNSAAGNKCHDCNREAEQCADIYTSLVNINTRNTCCFRVAAYCDDIAAELSAAEDNMANYDEYEHQ